MKRTIAPTTLVMVFATVFVLGIVPSAQAGQDKECSNASINGDFGLTLTGTIVGMGDVVAVGRVTADGQGNFVRGSFTQSLNGTISRMTFTGTYNVTADCMGSATINIEGGGERHRDIVVVDNGREVRAVSTDPGTVVTLNLKKQFSKDD